MKRWILIAMLVLFFVAGVGSGIMGSYQLWNVAYTIGGIVNQKQINLETQYFKEMVSQGQDFRLGDYTFKTVDRKRKVVAVTKAPAPAPAMGGKE